MVINIIKAKWPNKIWINSEEFLTNNQGSNSTGKESWNTSYNTQMWSPRPKPRPHSPIQQTTMHLEVVVGYMETYR